VDLVNRQGSGCSPGTRFHSSRVARPTPRCRRRSRNEIVGASRVEGVSKIPPENH
jgi:hypothetical protein